MLSLIVLTVVVLSLLPILAFSTQCFSAILPRRPAGNRRSGPRPRCTVLVPAHDEARTIAAALRSLDGQLREGDRVLVVADNCIDDTAAVARGLGADVVERTDPDAIGKDHALAFGVASLSADPPDVLVVLDADTTMDPGALDWLAGMAAATDRPVQGAYRMEPPASRTPRELVTFFAVTVKNVVRPMGLERLGLPCPLTGSGFAVPWHVLRRVSLATGDIVEDVRMGIDLAIAGYPPRFCPEASVAGRLHADGERAGAQRRRWEHGQIANLVRQVPRLAGAAWRQRRGELLAMAADVAVPPLALLTLGWLAAATLAVVTGMATGAWTAAGLAMGGGALLAVSVLAVRARFLGDALPLRALASVPGYVFSKIPMYLAVPFGRQTRWEEKGTAAPAPAPHAPAPHAPAPHTPAPHTPAPHAPAHARPRRNGNPQNGHVVLAGTRLRACTEQLCVEHVLAELADGRGGWIITMNMDHIRRCRHESAYAELSTRASLIVADGTPLIWASRIQGTPLPERVAGSRLIHSLSAGAARAGRSVFLLGGTFGAAEAAVDVLRARHPELRISGTSEPQAGYESRPGDLERIEALLADAAPDIVFVGLGSPKQEHLIDRIRERYPSTWWIGVGVSFSFVAGYLPVAPRWMQTAGLEWVHRLACEPRRLAHRYLVEDLPFAVKMLGGITYRRLARGGVPNDRDSKAR